MLKEEHRELLTYKNITRDLIKQMPIYIFVAVLGAPLFITFCVYPEFVALMLARGEIIVLIGFVAGLFLSISALVRLIVYSNKKHYKVVTDRVVGFQDVYSGSAAYNPMNLQTALRITFRDHGEFKTKDRMLYSWSEGWHMSVRHLSRYLHVDDECYIVMLKNKIYGVYPKSLFRLEGEPQKKSSLG